MGWEKRQRGGEYYVMKTRFGNQVVSHYVGQGETANLISQMQEIYAEKARCQAEEKRRERAGCPFRAQFESEIEAYCRQVRGIFRQEMEAAGWYLHRRQWRRGRTAVMVRAKAQPEPLIMRAQKDEAASREILEQWKSRETLRENLALVYQAYFGYGERRGSENPLLKVAIEQRTDDLRRELTTPDDTALEQMLIDRVIVCFHAMNDAEGTFQNINRQVGVTLTKIEHYDKATDRAQRRYLTAVRELGLARRLRLPKREVDEQEARLRVLPGGKPAPLLIEPKDAA